jgi:hypothetical protein
MVRNVMGHFLQWPITTDAKALRDRQTVYIRRQLSTGSSGNGRHVATAAEKLTVPARGPMSAFGVRREKAALSSGCKSHPAIAPAGSNRSSHGGNEVAEAFG